MLLQFLIFVLSVNLCASTPSVIIIGAGPSGIAAATRLLKNGITNITVLEAENRIGGRVYSVPFGKDYVDLGAEWCHGNQSNIVYDLINHLNILRPVTYVDPIISHSKYKILWQAFSNNLTNTFREIYDLPREAVGSSGDYLTNKYEEKISWLKYTSVGQSIARDAIQLLEMYTNAMDGTFSWYNGSAPKDYEGINTEDLSWDGHGYKTILEFMMQKYPDPSKALPIDDKILLNKEVEQILWKSDEVVVKCKDGSTYSADYVIVTVSLGVLKHRHDTLFTPKLPADKATAIERIGFEAVHKLFLHFNEKWWNDTANIFCFVWDKDDDIQFKEGPIKDGKSWLTSISIISGVSHNPNVLSVWFTGPFVPDIEKCSDEIITDGIMYLFDYFKIADANTITHPDKIVRAKWFTNPHFRGTYSFQTMNTRRGENSDESILSTPLGHDLSKPNLLFAGEATSPKHFSTVHGAIESGFREADRILERCK
ncbi:hypothetical protein FQR65_LT09335 [Abscondita terminalis]|nr:hypothetical protein FQR65_LT09335 [Abscondita terminalis]